MEDDDATSDNGWDLVWLSQNLKWESNGMETFSGECHELELYSKIGSSGMKCRDSGDKRQTI